MTRVLLFVQRGEGRPKCVTPKLHPWAGPNTVGMLPKFLSAYQRDCCERADRWWLVECENAEAGRLVIASPAVAGDTVYTHGSRVLGRILASGGRP